MKALAAFLLCFLFLVAPCRAEDKEESSWVEKKYGEEGLRKETYFIKTHKEAVKPVSTTKKTYRLKYTIDEDGKNARLTAPIGKNDMCKMNKKSFGSNGIATETDFTEALYEIDAHQVVVQKILCPHSIYDFDEQAVRSTDGVSSKIKVFRDGKQVFNFSFPFGDAEPWIYGDELFLRIEKCCNMDSYFERHNWVTGKTIEKDMLHTSLDDAQEAE